MKCKYNEIFLLKKKDRRLDCVQIPALLLVSYKKRTL